jgi:hypothetical protein
MKASGKIGSNGVWVSDNVRKRFETDIYNGNYIPTFRDNLSVTSEGVKRSSTSLRSVKLQKKEKHFSFMYFLITSVYSGPPLPGVAHNRPANEALCSLPKRLETAFDRARCQCFEATYGVRPAP